MVICSIWQLIQFAGASTLGQMLHMMPNLAYTLFKSLPNAPFDGNDDSHFIVAVVERCQAQCLADSVLIRSSSFRLGCYAIQGQSRKKDLRVDGFFITKTHDLQSM